MWVKSYSKIFKNIRKEQVWKAWTDVNQWPKWDEEIEYCQMKGRFERGTQFTLKPKGGPKVNITLSVVVENKIFTDYSYFFGAKMTDRQELQETDDGLCIKNTIMVTGLLRALWVKLVAKDVYKSFPVQMEALVKYAGSLKDD